MIRGQRRGPHNLPDCLARHDPDSTKSVLYQQRVYLPEESLWFPYMQRLYIRKLRMLSIESTVSVVKAFESVYRFPLISPCDQGYRPVSCHATRSLCTCAAVSPDWGGGRDNALRRWLWLGSNREDIDHNLSFNKTKHGQVAVGHDGAKHRIE